MNDYINIGRIVATFGLKGEVILQHALGKKTTLKGVEAVFVEDRKGAYLPWFIESSKAKDQQEIYLKIDGIDSKEQAHKLIQKQVWLLNDDFRKVVGKSSPIALLGFELVNEGAPLGTVEEVIEQPHQVLLRITINNKEALIPLHEETLNKIDQKKKQVHVTLPDGLLDIYR
ncbi:MAG: ribosome maturation factor RimM [Ilyomonas sp.]